MCAATSFRTCSTHLGPTMLMNGCLRPSARPDMAMFAVGCNSANQAARPNPGYVTCVTVKPCPQVCSSLVCSQAAFGGHEDRAPMGPRAELALPLE